MILSLLEASREIFFLKSVKQLFVFAYSYLPICIDSLKESNCFIFITILYNLGNIQKNQSYYRSD